jgi:hypothetical protein
MDPAFNQSFLAKVAPFRRASLSDSGQLLS